MLDFNSQYLLWAALILSAIMACVALGNWLLRRRGGFARGWSAAIFIAACWVAGIAAIYVKLR